MGDNCDSLSLAKDYIYVIFTPIQTLFGLVFLHWWWDRRKSKKADKQREEDREKADKQRDEDRQEADKQREEARQEADKRREEARQEADAEKIAAILSKNFYEVENSFHKLKKSVELRKNKIVGKWTEFDVLLYMCREENWQKFHETPQSADNDSDNFLPEELRRTRGVRKTEGPRDAILSDVEKIMKFFLKFRFKLFSIMKNKACPDDIKLEFASKITEMGKAIYPFVEKHRQLVIERVLRYFEGTDFAQEQGTPCPAAVCSSQTEMSRMQGTSNANQPFSGEQQASRGETGHCTSDTTNEVSPLLDSPNANQQSSGDQETSRERSGLNTSDTVIEMSPLPGPSNANQPSSEGSQGPELKPYAGNTEIENKIPYIEYFKYKDGKMSCNLRCGYSAIGTLAMYVEMGQMQEKKSEILRRIKEFLPAAGDGLLHSVRMVMFELSKDSGENELVLPFVEYAKSLVNSPSNATKRAVSDMCERSLDEIKAFIGHLECNYKALLESTTTQKFLKDYAEKMRQFIKTSLSQQQAPAN